MQAAGVYAVAVTVWLLALFRRRFDYTSPLLRKLAGAAYTVYLIHPWVITPLCAGRFRLGRGPF